MLHSIDEPIDRPQLPLGSHPRIESGDLRVTTFAVGLPFVTAIQALDDGSILAAVNDPSSNGRFLAATGKLLRLDDADSDGVADRIDPIGILHTCWPDRWGIPRQAGLVPESWGELVLSPHVPGDSLRGLDG